MRKFIKKCARIVVVCGKVCNFAFAFKQVRSRRLLWLTMKSRCFRKFFYDINSGKQRFWRDV